MGLETAAIMGISAGISALGTGASFLQASKQRKKQEAAERAAAKSMEDAKAKLQTNFYEGISIQKEAYDLEREAGLSGLGQIVQAGKEGEQRGAAVTAGKAALFNQAQQAQTRTAMSKEMQDLEKLVASEDSRLRDARTNIDLGEAAGQQRIAADARAARQAANQAGVSGLMNLGQQAMKIPGLYGAGGDVTQLANSGALVNNNALDSQLMSPTDANFGTPDLQNNLQAPFRFNNIFENQDLSAFSIPQNTRTV